MQRIIKISFLITLFFIIGVFFIGLNKDANYNTISLVGKKISNINLEHFEDNTFYKDNDLKKNNYTLINFWASWCAPCRDEHPLLIQLSKEKNLKILGINFKDKKANAINFLNELGNPYYEILSDKNGKESVNFGIYGIPESILIDKNFKIIKKFIGPINKNDYEEIIIIIKN